MQLSLAMSHPRALIAGARAAKSYPRWLRPFVASFLKEVKHLNFIRKQMGALIAPVLKERSSKLKNEPNYELPCDLISWTIRESNGKAWEPLIQVENQTTIGKPLVIVYHGKACNVD